MVVEEVKRLYRSSGPLQNFAKFREIVFFNASFHLSMCMPF